VVAVIFVALLQLRLAPTGEDEKLDAADYLMNFSYNETYTFIVYYFSNHDPWYGQVFGDLLIRFTPFTNSTASPPIDEGVYIYNLYMGRHVFPPTDMSSMLWNSWPPNTFGNGFMNFRLTGVVIFCFLQGFLTGTAFRVASNMGFRPIPLFIYFWTVFGFYISNIFLVQSFLVGAGVFLISLLVPLLRNLTGTAARRAHSI
jgi:hypothetical protein